MIAGIGYGLSFSPKGDMALVANRADGTISVLKIDGTNVTQTETVPIGPGVSHVVFTPDGRHALALKSPDNKVALLDIDGECLRLAEATRSEVECVAVVRPLLFSVATGSTDGLLPRTARKSGTAVLAERSTKLSAVGLGDLWRWALRPLRMARPTFLSTPWRLLSDKRSIVSASRWREIAA